jgi:hypothetical protein
MKNNKSNTVVLGLFIILFLSTDINAFYMIDIPIYTQQGNHTCWAACSRMVIGAYGYNESENTIVSWVYGVWKDTGNFLYGTLTSVDGVIYEFGGNPGTQVFAAVPTPDDVVLYMEMRRPIIAYWREKSGLRNGHMVVIKGYYQEIPNINTPTNLFILFNEPKTGRELELSYAEFKNNNVYSWEDAINIITQAPYLTTGIAPGEYVKINKNTSTTVISQSLPTITFNAQKGGPHIPVTWYWKLFFTHANGDYLAASWTNPSTSFQSTWNLPNIVLPSNYPWQYNFNGHIYGKVTVYVDDMAGPPGHDDQILVTYVPNGPLYPGILVYANQTVSGTQPEVKAHELIIIENDQFLPGSNITFRSGEKINIGTGITIQNGSNVNFTVDPSIR